MFDAKGNYTPPDKATRHVHISTQAHQVMMRDGMPTPVAAGTVHAVAMRGATHCLMGPSHRHPQAAPQWIEHATANVGDILPAHEFEPLVAAAQDRQAAVETYWVKVNAPEAPEAKLSLARRAMKALGKAVKGS